jgi:hypothetical protein
MRIKNSLRVCALAVLCTAAAMADHGGDNRGNNDNNNNNNANANRGAFSSAVVGSVPGSTVGGVASGGVPWVTREGSASLSSSGRIHVEVSGLLIAAGAGVPANLVGTVGPVQMVAASLVCGGSGGTVAGSTDGVQLSAAGNAEIEGTLTLPSSCVAPVILVRVFNNAAVPGSQLGPFIAVTGVTASAAAADDRNNNNNNNQNDDPAGHH